MPSGHPTDIGPYLPRILVRSQDIEWKERGACFRKGPDVFFPNSTDPEEEAAAKAICATCDVQWECLEFALAGREDGIWGHTNTRERERIRRDRAGRRRRRGAA